MENFVFEPIKNIKKQLKLLNVITMMTISKSPTNIEYFIDVYLELDQSGSI
jgi:hypothetical protein